ncbi:unnamed protein product [Calicophoron daubneyi]|uniref:Tetratricopeptide repeat protein 29 n=1 Tax=Calicophoron daubneyi TaxID=300641 RepID=A0AAV2TG70_CALDB
MSPATVSTKNSRGNIAYKNGAVPRPPRRLKPLSENTSNVSCTISRLPRVFVAKLKQKDIDAYRLPFFENTCITLLRAGYHSTSEELLLLDQMQDNMRKKAGPASPLWNETPLRKREEPLRVIFSYLLQAENADMQEQYDEVYRNNLAIADYFRGSDEDRWLVKHFLCKCNSICKRTIHLLKSLLEMWDKDTSHKWASQTQLTAQKADLEKRIATGERRLFESAYHLVSFLAESGDYDDAIFGARNLYHELKTCPRYKKPPADPGKELTIEWEVNAPSLISVVCECICKCSIALHQTIEYETSEEKIKALREAFEFADEAGNKLLIAQCKLLIGEEYEREQSLDLALQYANEYHKLAQNLADPIHKIQACKTLARIHGKNSDMLRAEEYLTELGHLAASCDEPQLSAEVSSLLAEFHMNETHDFEKANYYADTGFHLSLGKADQGHTNKLRAWLGIAKGQLAQRAVLQMLVASHFHGPSLESLLKWRSTRTAVQLLSEAEFGNLTKQTFQHRAEHCNARRIKRLIREEMSRRT